MLTWQVKKYHKPYTKKVLGLQNLAIHINVFQVKYTKVYQESINWKSQVMKSKDHFNFF